MTATSTIERDGMRLKIMIAGALAAGVAISATAIADMADPVAAPAAKKRAKLKITDGDFGRILTNGKGRALYVFTSDSGKTSNCYDDCARAWPPYIVSSKPRAVGDARPGLVGTTRRADGRLQATYAGHAVYFYEHDNEPGEVLCQAVQEFGGFWYVIRASGKVVR
jgi:predicted lipoprotein with Yx(FWY)xxD motif